jgi:hypothetical protein
MGMTNFITETTMVMSQVGWAGVQARKADAENYVGFETSFEHNMHRFYKVTEGKSKNLVMQTSTLNDPLQEIELALKVDGSTATGYINGEMVFEVSDVALAKGNALQKGSFGMSTSASIGTKFTAFRVGKATPKLINLALDRPTEQSSTSENGASNRAVDGNTNMAYSGGSCTHTNSATRSWWKVELAASVEIDNVEIWNRDSIGSRLNKFSVQVGDINSPGSNPKCGNTRKNSVDENSSKKISCNKLKGKYVFIQIEKDSQEILTLCEVKVFAEVPADKVAIYKQPLALEACDGSTLTMQFERADATAFSQADCQPGPSGSVVPLTQFETPIPAAQNVQSILLLPGKDAQILGRASSMETVTEDSLDTLDLWSVKGAVTTVGGVMMGRGGETAIATTAATVSVCRSVAR